ncbi:CTD small phosphatase-like protein 2-A isoform X4 [Chrysemys picta bellii]|uniref:CTD small phosphatase-like protein 2-A isoform X4 n=1 Tax=Chrysemys picta bellii TaxID=8478 RepID=UPI0032B2203B
MMLRSGKITPRVKKPFSPRETTGDVEDLGPPARKASVPRGGKSRWRGWQEDGTTEPVSPLMGRAMKVHFEQCPSSPASKAASFQIPPLGVVCFSPLGTEEPESPWVQRGKPRAQPMGGVVYFGDLPLDEPEETGILSPFIHKALPPRSSQKPPRKETPIKTRSTPESTLVLELVSRGVSLQGSGGDPGLLLPDIQPGRRLHLPHRLPGGRLSGLHEAAPPRAGVPGNSLQSLRDLCLHHREAGLHREDPGCLGPSEEADQISNWVPIPGWLGDRQDEELLRVLPLLGKLSQAGDVRTEIQRKYRLCRLLAVD